ncbi:LacI family DNA-binding transcriptional regulator [Paenibacillus roseipurpureus]|uniref:LacI family DNA-binding transcriptional regulator n=1 Tax=Paenibacillus roseopurpureus TaxID=2918901 RepID=A0AA96LNT2_9BACL|nr:LacI family DNA-binding transcriptional regulator [Paenibacillus sp. MBLB1832]WNR43123.1 LacI family DNA-binding transcriptional regulator [Paenibacillus sp. MBLB1832]
MKATIYDVAREAGVSIAAVSQVMNGKGKISEERRAEILKVMEKLNYQPSVIASALTGKKTYTLGLLVPDISNPFFAEIARAVEDQGHEMGYSLVICSTDNKDERVERYLSLLQQKSVDGMIIGTGMDNKEMLKPLMDRSIPIVMIAREMQDLALHTVVCDDFVGGCMAAQHFVALGHKRLAILAEHTKVTSSRERVKGFVHTLEEAGMTLSDHHVRNCRYTAEDGKREALELLELPPAERPTALFCCNDMLAIGALQAAKQLKLRVPEDVSVVGFDNTILASVTDPPLTTIAQPIEPMGKKVVDLLLLELKKKSQDKQRVVMRPELIVRQSTGAPGHVE